MSITVVVYGSRIENFVFIGLCKNTDSFRVFALCYNIGYLKIESMAKKYWYDVMKPLWKMT